MNVIRDGFRPGSRWLSLGIFLGLSATVDGVQEEGPVVGTPEEKGVHSEVLVEMSRWVREEGLDVRSLLVMRQGSLILEWYAGEVSRQHNHNVFSVTKSVVATMAGVALHQGVLRDVEVTVGEVFPEVPGADGKRWLGKVTLEQLLTMRSGLPTARGNRPDGPERELFQRLHEAPDRVSFALNLELTGDPGRRFAYGNVEPELVLSMLEHAYGMKALPLTRKWLFDPLGFRNVEWDYADESGSAPGGYGLRLRALDMVRLGQLFLESGRWEGQTLLAEEWVRKATSNLVAPGYGYFWWTEAADGEPVFLARGVRGQQVFVHPGKDLVFVVTADLPPDRVRGILRKLSYDFVLRAADSEGVLPGNEAAAAALAQELKMAASYVPSHREGLARPRLPRIP